MTFSAIEHARKLDEQNADELLLRLYDKGYGWVTIYCYAKPGNHGRFHASISGPERLTRRHEAFSVGAVLRRALRDVSAKAEP